MLARRDTLPRFMGQPRVLPIFLQHTILAEPGGASLKVLMHHPNRAGPAFFFALIFFALILYSRFSRASPFVCAAAAFRDNANVTGS